MAPWGHVWLPSVRTVAEGSVRRPTTVRWRPADPEGNAYEPVGANAAVQPDDDPTVPPEAAAVTGRYRRAALAASGVFTLVVLAVALAVYVWTDSLVTFALAGLGLAVAARAPVYRTEGTTVLAADADPESVRADFRGPTPPPLAFQWGGADEVRETDDGAIYDISHPLGLGSVRMTVAVRSLDPEDDAVDVEDSDGNVEDSDGNVDDGNGDLQLFVTTDDRAWATYTVSFDERGGSTVAEVEVTSDRRFGLRRIPQLLVVPRYRRAAMAAQDYTIVDHDTRIRIRG